jgi:hypothetical protein
MGLSTSGADGFAHRPIMQPAPSNRLPPEAAEHCAFIFVVLEIF